MRVKSAIAAAASIGLAGGAAAAQEPSAINPPAAALAEVPAPAPEDVKSIDAIVNALYAVISGPKGQKRDWARFKSLFYPGARMIPSGINPRTKLGRANVITPDQYIESSGPLLENDGFHEMELARRVEAYGTIAHVFSTYEGRIGTREQLRGINSFQLFNDGQRWWVLTIAWSSETPDQPIPRTYLKSPK
jgi:hypothetical protein